MGVTRKTEIETIDGTPEKRLFLSIISDYNLQTGLCELVDNALDLWITNYRKPELVIDVTLDVQRQMISVEDNAGGVREPQLRLLIAPGASRNRPQDELIGIFGVGGKRAGVALGELVEIRSRYRKERSLQIDINDEWLSSDDWHIAVYEVSDIKPSTTRVDISKLRQGFNSNDVDAIRKHFSETYAWFIEQGCELRLNGTPIAASNFDSWAYPPQYVPRQANFEVSPTGSGILKVEITAGLIRDRDPEAENYGVYFYCNHRLIVKELRTRDVGYFVSGEAGVPHPDASLCRVVVHLQGPAELMPWNSSKSGINYSHPAFIQLRPNLIDLVSFYSSLSRRLKRDWPSSVFSYPNGDMETIESDEILLDKKIILPQLPRVRKPPRVEEIKTRNRKILKDQPWTIGLVEALGIVDVIHKQKLDTKNRSALILLDSNFEIALKEFIVNRPDLFTPGKYNDSRIAALFKNRNSVINEVNVHANFSQALLRKVAHYYALRNKLIHERATVGITDSQVSDYRKTIEQVLTTLFDLKFPKD